MAAIETIPNRMESGSGRPSRGVPEVIQQQIKSAVHRELIKRLDLDRLADFNQTRSGQSQLFSMIQGLLAEQGIPLSGFERDKLGSGGCR